MYQCSKCGAGMSVTDAHMLRYWVAQTGANAGVWKNRLGNAPARVCPKCDAYALGAELTHGLPFYSEAAAAYLTINDWDWWNRDPKECDIRPWPDFGCLTFSESALRSSVEYLRKAEPEALKNATPLTFEPELVGPTGIPEDDNPAREWTNQLSILHERMREEFSHRELNVAVRTLVRALVDASNNSGSG